MFDTFDAEVWLEINTVARYAFCVKPICMVDIIPRTPLIFICYIAGNIIYRTVDIAAKVICNFIVYYVRREIRVGKAFKKYLSKPVTTTIGKGVDYLFSGSTIGKTINKT